MHCKSVPAGRTSSAEARAAEPATRHTTALRNSVVLSIFTSLVRARHGQEGKGLDRNEDTPAATIPFLLQEELTDSVCRKRTYAKRRTTWREGLGCSLLKRFRKQPRTGGYHNNSSVCLTKYTPRVRPGLRSGSGFQARSEQRDCFWAGGPKMGVVRWPQAGMKAEAFEGECATKKPATLLAVGVALAGISTSSHLFSSFLSFPLFPS